MAHAKITFAIILLLAAGVYSDSLADEASQIQSSVLLEQADRLFDANSIDQAQAAYTQASEAASQEGNNSDLTEAYSQIARCYLESDKIEDGRLWLEKAKAIASIDEPGGWSRFLSVVGRFQWKDNLALKKEPHPVSSEAAATFKKSYNYCIDNELYKRAIDAADMLAVTGEFEERIDWAKKGIAAAEERNMRNSLGKLWNNLGWAYDELGRYEESLAAMQEARKYNYLEGKELSMLNADLSVGHAYRMCGKLDSAYTIMNDVQRWALIRKGENRSPENAESLGNANFEMGELMIIKKNYTRALSCFKAAYSNLRDAGVAKWNPEKLKLINERVQEVTSLDGKK